MPTYEYQCERCEGVFEVWQRISDPPLATCQKCGGPVRRLLAPAPFILKGSGFYATDYPSEARKKAQEAEKKASRETSAPSESSSSTTSSSPSGS